MGRYTRRLRRVAGLSQHQLAELAGVSQGAISRLEAGRAVNTPLIVVMKINEAMRRALATLPAGVLSEEARRLMDVPARGTPRSELGLDVFSVAIDDQLGAWVELFWRVPPRQRRGLVDTVRRLTSLLSSSDEPAGGSRNRTA